MKDQRKMTQQVRGGGCCEEDPPGRVSGEEAQRLSLVSCVSVLTAPPTSPFCPATEPQVCHGHTLDMLGVTSPPEVAGTPGQGGFL